MKKIALLLALVMTLLCVVSCGEEKSGGLSIDPSTTSQASDTQIVSGLMDESYTLSKNITKIICLSPAASIIAENLGVADKIIAIDAVSADYVSFSASETDASGAAALAPEVIIVSESDLSAIGQTDIPVYAVPTATSVADINNLTRLIAKIAGISADEAVKNLTNVMSTAQMGSSIYASKLTAYVDLGDGKTVGSGTYVTEMLYASGLENICTIEGFGEMAEADVIAANPEFIITTGSASDFLDNPAFAAVDAVRNGYVYEIDEKDIIFGSNNVGNAVSQMYEKVSIARDAE